MSSLLCNIKTSRLWHVLTPQRHHIATLGVFDSNVMSSHFTSHHVTSYHVTSLQVTSHRNIKTSQCCSVKTFWVRMNNVATLGTNVATLLSFSSDEKVAKIQSLGLLLTSKLFLLHINHPRSSHDHIHKEQH